MTKTTTIEIDRVEEINNYNIPNFSAEVHEAEKSEPWYDRLWGNIGGVFGFNNRPAAVINKMVKQHLGFSITASKELAKVQSQLLNDPDNKNLLNKEKKIISMLDEKRKYIAAMIEHEREYSTNDSNRTKKRYLHWFGRLIEYSIYVALVLNIAFGIFIGENSTAYKFVSNLVTLVLAPLSAVLLNRSGITATDVSVSKESPDSLRHTIDDNFQAIMQNVNLNQSQRLEKKESLVKIVEEKISKYANDNYIFTIEQMKLLTDNIQDKKENIELKDAITSDKIGELKFEENEKIILVPVIQNSSNLLGANNGWSLLMVSEKGKTIRHINPNGLQIDKISEIQVANDYSKEEKKENANDSSVFTYMQIKEIIKTGNPIKVIKNSEQTKKLLAEYIEKNEKKEEVISLF
jgi:hypothetical protein